MKPLGSLLALTVPLLIVGCGKGPASSAKNEAEASKGNEPKKEESLNIVTTAGTADRRDPVKDAKLYTISWKSAAITLGRDAKDRGTIKEGTMNAVNGIVYEAEKGVDKPKSTFTADSGYAKKATQTLFLEGRVVVKSPAYNATLKAKKLEWLPDVKRYRATGNVTLTTPTGTSGPMPELLATSDLKRFGTPDLFDKR